MASKVTIRKYLKPSRTLDVCNNDRFSHFTVSFYHITSLLSLVPLRFDGDCRKHVYYLWQG